MSEDQMWCCPDGHLIKCKQITDDYHFSASKVGGKTIGTQLDYRGVEYVARYLRWRVDSDLDNPIMVTGERGSGKSNYSIELALYTDPDFSAEDVVFKMDEFRERIATRKTRPGQEEYPVVIFDEAGFDLFSQQWQQNFQQDYVKRLQVNRASLITSILNLPHRNLLNATVRDSLLHLWIEVIMTTKRWKHKKFDLKRGIAEIRYADINKYSKAMTWWKGFIATQFLPIEHGYLIDRFAHKNTRIYKDYLQRKFEFIEEVDLEKYNPADKLGKREKKYKERLERLIIFLNKEAPENKRMKQEEIAEILGIDRTTITDFIQAAVVEV